jgi:hypothetical protein
MYFGIIWDIVTLIYKGLLVFSYYLILISFMIYLIKSTK